MNEQFQNQIDQLRTELEAVKSELHDKRYVTKDFSDTVLGIVFRDRNIDGTAKVISITGTAYALDVSDAFDGYIQSEFRGKQVDIPIIVRSEI